jgi:membrane-associated phospholipid phosphatase
MVAALYFGYLASTAIARRKVRPLVLSIAALLFVVAAGMPHVMPLVYLLLGYWLPALLVTEPNGRFQRLLVDVDHKLFGATGLARFAQTAPRVLIEYLELSYLLCYAVVPAGYLCLLLAGYGPDAVNRFWSIVLLASFLCYGLLPWLPTRAPRVVEPNRVAMRSWFRTLNLAVLNRGSVQWNTFPSGHTAASLATALAVGSYMPVAGIILGFLAVSIAAASVAGRYHYAADAFAGAAVAILAFLTADVARAL